MSNYTGDYIYLIAKCECGNEMECNKDFSFDPSDHIVAKCEQCGMEFCEKCKDEITECTTDGCTNKYCMMCASVGGMCDDCALEEEVDE